MISIYNNYLSDLQSRLKEIQNFISLIECQKKAYNELVSTDLSNLSHLNNYKEYMGLLNNSTVQYNAIIISLYACYEHFVDDIAKAYLNQLFHLVKNYENLPDSLQKKHIQKIAEFLVSPQRFKGYSITNKEVLNNIANCINETSEAKLNVSLILNHAGNLGINQLQELLRDIGIENSIVSILKDDKFIRGRTSLDDTCTKETLKADKGNTIAFGPLEELVSQRNSVSHGWVIDQRISIEKIKSEILPFIGIICEAICDLLHYEHVRVMFQEGLLLPFDDAIEIYNNDILCINSKDSLLHIGDYIFVKNTSTSYIAKILSLQINGQELSENTTSNIDIGLRLDKSVNKSCSFYYFPSL